MSIDVRVAHWMLDHRNPSLDAATRALMWLGSDLIGMAVTALVIVAVCLIRRRPRILAGAVGAIVMAQLATWALKFSIRRHRPGDPFALVHGFGYSMPSSAVAVTTAGLTVLVLLFSPKYRPLAAVVFLLLDAAIAFSVVYLGAHWFTDTCGGFALGLTIGLLIARLLWLMEVSRAEARGNWNPGSPADSR